MKLIERVHAIGKRRRRRRNDDSPRGDPGGGDPVEILWTARAFTGFSDFRKHYRLILWWPANTTRTMRGVNQNMGPVGGSFQGKLVNMRAVPGICTLGFALWDLHWDFFLHADFQSLACAIRSFQAHLV
jgi:hypothetical protein